MDIARRLASAQRRKDQHPNIDLAVELVDGWDEEAVAELFRLLDGGDRKQRHDALKVIYEVGIRAPELLLPHFDELIDALDTDDNRILWGCIHGLRSLVGHARERLMECLPLILDAAERSTIIARDKAMYILVALAADERYHDAVTPLMLEHVEAAATNQFPTYAERAATCLGPGEAPRLVAIIDARLRGPAGAAFESGDIPTVLGALAPDASWTEAEGFPYGGTYVGPEAVLENVFMKLGSEWDGFTAAVGQLVAEGDTVVALGTYSGTYKATGRSFAAPFVHVWSFEGELVQSFHQHTDTVVVQRALA